MTPLLNFATSLTLRDMVLRTSLTFFVADMLQVFRLRTPTQLVRSLWALTILPRRRHRERRTSKLKACDFHLLLPCIFDNPRRELEVWLAHMTRMPSVMRQMVCLSEKDSNWINSCGQLRVPWRGRSHETALIAQGLNIYASFPQITQRFTCYVPQQTGREASSTREDVMALTWKPYVSCR